MKKAATTAVILVSLFCATAQAEQQSYRCSATKNTVNHILHIKIDGDKLGAWTYIAATPGGDSSTTCSVASTDGRETDSVGVQSYSTSAGKVTVTKTGDSFVFDFSSLEMSQVCGQSSAMAKHITITPGSKRCTNVANAT